DDAILVVICHLIKQAIFILCHTINCALEFTILFLIHVFAKHGLLNEIIFNYGML
ncbi:hypothetical protein C0995_013818, partial [Termitomyces sp. Mi166